MKIDKPHYQIAWEKSKQAEKEFDNLLFNAKQLING